MKRLVASFVILFSALASVAQEETFEPSHADFPSIIAKSHPEFSAFTMSLSERNTSNDRVFLHRIFNQTQSRFLKNYSAYSEFQDLFSSGRYDCLTATSLFSLVLDEFHFDYSIIETNYHIFLIVHTQRGDVLIETTDRINGFVVDDKEIQNRIGSYRQNQVTADNSDKKVYLYHTSLYRELTSKQLPGLLYFNQAIRSFNVQDWERCSDMLEQAGKIYDTPRIGELAAVLMQTVEEHERDVVKKKKIMSRLHRYFVSKTVARL